MQASLHRPKLGETPRFAQGRLRPQKREPLDGEGPGAYSEPMTADPFASLNSRAALLAALGWLAELGADEALAETPQDRYAEAKHPPTPAAAFGAARPAPAQSSPAQSPPVRAAARPASPPPPAPSAAEQAAQAQAQAETESAQALAALARGARDLDALRAAVEAFEHPLRATARRAVFEDGLRGARLMVVGEAPGADEDRLGKPFVGRSGQLLDRMLGAIGLDRAAQDPERAFYLGNVLPFRPPKNRTPSAAEMTLFLPSLERQIALAKPEVLLLAGGTPSKALLRTPTGIMRLRGAWSLIRIDGREIPVLPMFHPAFLLRAPDMKALAWRDLLSLRQRLDGLRNS